MSAATARIRTGWVYASFDDVVKVVSDRGYRIKQKSYLETGSIAVVDQGDGLIGGYTNDTAATVDHPAPVIVFGDHTRRFKYVNFPFAPGADGVKLLAATELWEPRFLFYQLEAIDLEDRGYGRHYQQLRKTTLSIPPRPEQARIVEKLDELLSDLEAGVSELEAAERKLTQYRRSLLKSAIEGVLTADWRSAHGNPQETGAELLRRILSERRVRWERKQTAKFAEQGKALPHGWRAKYPEPIALDDTDLSPLPKGWTWASVDQLASVGTGVTPLRSNRSYFDKGEIPWTTSGALNDEIITSPSDYVTKLAASQCRLDLYPAGTLLVAMYGEGKTRGKCAELAIPSTINQAIAAIAFEGVALAVKSHVKTFFLDAYEAMREQASGGVQPNLNLQIIKALAIPLPPIAEQVEIQHLLQKQLVGCRRVKESAALTLAQAAAQRKNLLKAAVAGQLVPQDPADEPASELLARIRTSHASNDGSTQRRRRRTK